MNMLNIKMMLLGVTIRIVCLVLKHGYKIKYIYIYVNPITSHLIKCVKSFNLNLLILYYIHLNSQIILKIVRSKYYLIE
jgi:hypothetical protein